MARYEIQIKDVIGGEWQSLSLAKSFRTLRAARKEWWRWVNKEWLGDLVVLRIWDSKEGKAIE